eukprot:TRINITY_DN9566_c0_g1_i2.p1 TRINITY_DN9566_c0_g1~~TRINITY_DN9566_c0_g1_i2.p1  ORF type:complete len:505 (+),score=34.46 TRINITY_DN9566_c0_g1_i2:71-1516(+)
MDRRLKLNTASHTQTRTTAGGRAAGLGNVMGWQLATEQRLKAADSNAEASVILRNTTQNAHVGIDRETRQAHGSVNERLKRKVSQTLSLKRRLECLLAETSEEISLLTQHRQHAMELVQHQKAPLAKAQHRLRARGTRRPERENIHDKVQDALMDEAGDVQRTIDHVKHGVAEMTITLEQMLLAKATLKRDLEDKTESLDLDKQCLSLAADNVSETGKVDPIGFVRRTLAAAVAAADDMAADPASAGTRQLTRESKTHPAEWRASTEDALNAARTLVLDSRKLRKRVSLFCKQSLHSSSQKAERTTQALEHKIKHATRLTTGLQARLDDVDQELSEVVQQRSAISAALNEKYAPLRTCAKRLNLRRQRPCREAVRDEAEVHLHTQLDSLVRCCRELEEQYRSLSAREAELKRLRRDLESDRSDKERARDLDTELLTLDPVVVRDSPASSRPVTPADDRLRFTRGTPSPLRSGFSVRRSRMT